MNVLLYDRIVIKTPDFDKHPEKSKTNNTDWRKCLFIIFKDFDGKEYSFMPKWSDIQQFNAQKDSIEKMNSDIAKYNSIDLARKLESSDIILREYAKHFQDLFEFKKFVLKSKYWY